MDILIATNNQHKLHEFRAILAGHRVLAPRDLGLEFDHDETGSSFFENSFGKAHSLYQVMRRQLEQREWPAILADDSGLVVPALDGEPGIHSARYGSVPGGPVLNDADRNRLLLERLKGARDRRAWYVCCMVLLHSPERFGSVQEIWEGSIVPESGSGSGGFGYDPLFWLPDQACTVADLPEGHKARMSHRAKASQQIVRLLQG